MRAYVELVEKLAEGVVWDDAVIDFLFGLGAMGIEKWADGKCTIQRGVAFVHSAKSIEWSIRELVVAEDSFYRVYTKKGNNLNGEDDALSFIRSLDRLLHDHEMFKMSALHDPLTRALNRRGLEEWFRARTRGGEYGLGFVLVCMDLDHFKELNDTHGHDRGDEALVEITAAIKRTLRTTDVVVRLGGDEFVFVIDQVPYHPDIRNRLDDIVSELPLERYGLTVTMGAVCFPTHGTRLPDLLTRADVGLYKGKAEGKNRIVLWEECRND